MSHLYCSTCPVQEQTGAVNSDNYPCTIVPVTVNTLEHSLLLYLLTTSYTIVSVTLLLYFPSHSLVSCQSLSCYWTKRSDTILLITFMLLSHSLLCCRVGYSYVFVSDTHIMTCQLLLYYCTSHSYTNVLVTPMYLILNLARPLFFPANIYRRWYNWNVVP